MLTMNTATRCLGFALLAGLLTVSCGDDDDKGGSKTTGGNTSSSGAPGNPTAGADLGGAPVVGNGEVVRTDLVLGEEAAGGAGGAGGAAGAGSESTAKNLDPNLINAWGMSFNPDPAVATNFWVSAADARWHTGTAGGDHSSRYCW
jgi:hypothetical protein